MAKSKTDVRNSLEIRGARMHNLQNINLTIPRGKLTVFTGLSGSGKSSLAFDTIYAEGQRRYVESLSAYARQFLGLMDKPDVDFIEGLSPAISIEQKSTSRNPRSTVGTTTEIYDYLRLLFARVGVQHCHQCGNRIEKQTVSQIAEVVGEKGDGRQVTIMAPLVRERKGEYRELFEQVKKKGFVRVRVDGSLYRLEDVPALKKNVKHKIEAVVDRLKVSAESRNRLADSVETAAGLAGGLVLVDFGGGEERMFSEELACHDCGISYEELSPRLFSFNSPYGACEPCGGLGTRMEVDPELVVGDERMSIMEGVIKPWGEPSGIIRNSIIEALSEHYEFHPNTPWQDLPDKVKRVVLYGSGTEKLGIKYHSQRFKGEYTTEWEGVIQSLNRRFYETTSLTVKSQIDQFMQILPCPFCDGKRLKPQSLAVKVGGWGIGSMTEMPVGRLLGEFANIKLTRRQLEIGRQAIKEITERLQFMANVGLDYLTLERSAETLSGGEAQRIRLATQIGSHLVGVLYILDEPSIGLHQKDNRMLIDTLLRLRDQGNTVIVVEHDEETIRSADHIVDLGPGAGKRGGRVVAQGTIEKIETCKESITGAYLRGDKQIAVPAKRRNGNGHSLVVMEAAENNLQNLDVEFPLGKFICVTGVSGSGKSTLVEDILHRHLARRLHGSRKKAGRIAGLDGIRYIDKVIDVDQGPIGRTPRSNPATYTNVFGPIRDVFSELPESKMRGYKPGRFSFNVRGGRCESCQGDGLVKIEMHFLPDVYITCDICRGKRYNRETLEVGYKGRSIAEVLEMTVDEALDFFRNIPTIRSKLETLSEVGLGYIHLGQPATTLSGGEAQRVKLASELNKRSTGRTFYILDEPTTGLHFHDVKMLLGVLHRLVDMGNTVVVIEHNLEVIKTADYIIDLGPEGGERGGRLVATGTPEEVAGVKESDTGLFLRRIVVPAAAKKKQQLSRNS
ncbi:MAG: excinuclease ABC subunit UvrA [Candidatus Glassbacteria bacterium]|nr:excinuclease ABC subunit UvrA [Candidatus Glassbacteria bacterium]